MSMIGTLRAVRPKTIQLLLENPERIVSLVYGPEAAESYLRAKTNTHTQPSTTPNRGLFARLAGVFRKPQPDTQTTSSVSPPPAAQRPDSVAPQHIEDDGEELDIDKAWHGISFLLTGVDYGGSPPLNFIVAGGEKLGDIDVGYGPARAFTVEQVREITEAVSAVSPEQLGQRFDAEHMTAEDIYPTIWLEGDGALEYLQEHFHRLVDFLQRTADAKLGLLVYLT